MAAFVKTSWNLISCAIECSFFSWFSDCEQKDDMDEIHDEVYFSSGLVRFFLEFSIPAIGFLSLYYTTIIFLLVCSFFCSTLILV